MRFAPTRKSSSPSFALVDSPASERLAASGRTGGRKGFFSGLSAALDNPRGFAYQPEPSGTQRSQMDRARVDRLGVQRHAARGRPGAAAGAGSPERSGRHDADGSPG